MKRFLKNHSQIISTLQKYRESILLGLIILTSFVLFYEFISNYFFQDDFFILSISQANKISDFISFFIPRSDVQFYRPLAVQFFYFTQRSLFGLNPFGFHLIGFLLFITNIFLISRLTKYFFSSNLLRWSLTFFYSISAIHFDSLFWIANFSYILVSFFFLLGFLTYISSSTRPKSVIVSMILVLGLLSNEFMIVFPIVIALYTFLINYKSLEKNKHTIIALISITILYLLFRFTIFHSDMTGYKYYLDKKVIFSFRWFFLYFLNWSETMKDQMIHFYEINTKFMQKFAPAVSAFLINLIIFVSVFIITPLFIMIRVKQLKLFFHKEGRNIIFFVLWIITTLTPIIFIPSQISPHRGSIAFIGFLFLSFKLLEYVKNTVLPRIFALLLILTIISWLSSSFAAISVNKIVHWTYNRPRISKYWINKTVIAYPYIEKNSVLVLNTEGNEEKISLDKGRAFNVIYNDNSLRIFFSTNSAEYKGSIFIK